MKKQFRDYALYGLLAIVILTLVVTFSGFFAPGKEQPKASVSAGFRQISSGDTSDGSVSIDLTPVGSKNGVLQVNLVANTHSVDLSQFDLKQLTVLEYDGKAVNPVSAPGLSGHHTSGILEFEVGKELAKFTIRIKGIPSVEERVFKWD